MTFPGIQEWTKIEDGAADGEFLAADPTGGEPKKKYRKVEASELNGLGDGVSEFLGNPSSANLYAAVTNTTGSGALVFGTSPQLTTPALGTPSSIVLTNATNIPWGPIMKYTSVLMSYTDIQNLSSDVPSGFEIVSRNVAPYTQFVVVVGATAYFKYGGNVFATGTGDVRLGNYYHAGGYVTLLTSAALKGTDNRVTTVPGPSNSSASMVSNQCENGGLSVWLSAGANYTGGTGSELYVRVWYFYIENGAAV